MFQNSSTDLSYLKAISQHISLTIYLFCLFYADVLLRNYTLTLNASVYRLNFGKKTKIGKNCSDS